MDLIDTDVLIDVQRKHPPAVNWFANLSELPAVPGFVVMELIQDARNSQENRHVMKLIAPLTVVWPTEAVGFRCVSFIKQSWTIGRADCSLCGWQAGHFI